MRYPPVNELLLVSDLDGTLIGRDGIIPPENIEAVHRFVDAGGCFTVATGRTVESARRFVDQLPVTAPVIVMNGSLMYDYAREKIIWDHPLPQNAKTLIGEVYEAFPDIGIEVSSGRQLYVVNFSDIVREHIAYELMTSRECTMDTAPEVLHKALYATNPKRLHEVADFCRKQGGQGVDYVFSTEIYYEMIPQGVNKGSTLTVLSEILGYNIDKTVAIGDYYNDIEFIQSAGLGVLAGNAPKDLFDMADLVVCDHAEGAVAHLIGILERGV